MKMAIERIDQMRPVTATQQDVLLRQKSESAALPAVETDKESATQVKLSQVTQQVKTDTSRDIDMERVNTIKAQISTGQLTIDTDKIAQCLINEIFEFSYSA
ncbi:flagellar biosynthesis anti-sigma factor FlgM [Yersinia frederiksenii]|jgi:negative regulator of flagellin synthesis FlgM|nr:flagellar biosynthesis anti-sigma factor FlgM [Yersinia frederiksenii]